MTPSLYFFDMDHTLLDNDCDLSWKQFLVARGIAPESALQEADLFFEQYRRGVLDVPAFLEFQLREFRNRTPAEMEQLSLDHFTKVVQPRIYARARREVEAVRQYGKPVILLTATNRVIAQPLASDFGIDEIVATELEIKDGHFTGQITGTYCVGEGKVLKAQDYCRQHGVNILEACYYGDSVSDIPLLSVIGFPIACNPSPELEKTARKQQWPITHFA